MHVQRSSSIASFSSSLQCPSFLDNSKMSKMLPQNLVGFQGLFGSDVLHGVYVTHRLVVNGKPTACQSKVLLGS